MKLKKIKAYLVFTLLIILIVNLYYGISINKNINDKIEQIKEENRPANLDLLIINDRECKDCFDLNSLIDVIKKEKVNITQKIVDIKDSRDIIKEYGIEFVPTIIIKGEINKTKLELFGKINDALVLKDPIAPYNDLKENKIKGLVKLIILTNNCDKCTKLDNLIESIKGYGVKVINEKVIDANSIEGSNLISKYNIKKLPALILSEDAGVYDIIKNAWGQIGEFKEGSYIATKVNPPYYSLEENKIKGLVDVKFLFDKTCEICYNVSLHKQILNQFGVYINKEEFINVNTDKNLLKKYNITLIPTMILSKESNDYNELSKAWEQVGTIEEDGSFIFRKLEVMGTYKNLENNETITVTK